MTLAVLNGAMPVQNYMSPLLVLRGVAEKSNSFLVGEMMGSQKSFQEIVFQDFPYPIEEHTACVVGGAPSKNDAAVWALQGVFHKTRADPRHQNRGQENPECRASDCDSTNAFGRFKISAPCWA